MNDADLARASERRRGGPARLHGMLADLRKVFGSFEPRVVERGPDGLVVVTGVDGKGRACVMRVRVAVDAPHAIRSLVVYVAPAPGYTCRDGGPADYDGCARVEATTPTVAGDKSFTISRQADFRAYVELSGARLWVIEHDGEIVGWTAGAHRTLRHPHPVVLGYAAQAYLLPAHRDSRAFMQASALNNAWMQETTDGFFYFMNVGNDRSANFNRGRGYWSVPVSDLSIPTRAGGGAGRPASSDDLERVAALLNAAHRNEALFDSYDTESLRARLARSPDFYDVGQIRVGSHAAIGVCWAREEIAYATADGHARRIAVANILDYGYDSPAGVRELADLLRAVSAEARTRGFTHLSMLCSPSSSVYEALVADADDVEHYLMATGLPEPADLPARGLYADHVFF